MMMPAERCDKCQQRASAEYFGLRLGKWLLVRRDIQFERLRESQLYREALLCRVQQSVK